MRMSSNTALPVQSATRPQTVQTANQRARRRKPPSTPATSFFRSTLWLTNTNFELFRASVSIWPARVQYFSLTLLNNAFTLAPCVSHQWKMHLNANQTHLFKQHPWAELSGVRLFTLLFAWRRHVGPQTTDFNTCQYLSPNNSSVTTLQPGDSSVRM